MRFERPPLLCRSLPLSSSDFYPGARLCNISRASSCTNVGSVSDGYMFGRMRRKSP